MTSWKRKSLIPIPGNISPRGGYRCVKVVKLSNLHEIGNMIRKSAKLSTKSEKIGTFTSRY